MPYKIQPIRIQEISCTFDGIQLHLPIMRCVSSVFSMLWYIIVMQHFLVVYPVKSHKSIVFSRYTPSPKGMIDHSKALRN